MKKIFNEIERNIASKRPYMCLGNLVGCTKKIIQKLAKYLPDIFEGNAARGTGRHSSGNGK